MLSKSSSTRPADGGASVRTKSRPGRQDAERAVDALRVGAGGCHQDPGAGVERHHHVSHREPRRRVGHRPGNAAAGGQREVDVPRVRRRGHDHRRARREVTDHRGAGDVVEDLIDQARIIARRSCARSPSRPAGPSRCRPPAHRSCTRRTNRDRRVAEHLQPCANRCGSPVVALVTVPVIRPPGDSAKSMFLVVARVRDGNRGAERDVAGPDAGDVVEDLRHEDPSRTTPRPSRSTSRPAGREWCRRHSRRVRLPHRNSLRRRRPARSPASPGGLSPRWSRCRRWPPCAAADTGASMIAPNSTATAMKRGTNSP